MVELKERISVIIKENHLKQKDLAALMGVTQGYVSTLLSGRKQNISLSVANLIEEKLGYNARWLLYGEEPKYKQVSPNLSNTYRQIILQLEKLTESELKAVLAFINALEDIEKSFADPKETGE